MTQSKLSVLLVLLLPLFAGCAALENLDGLFTLNRYSQEKDAQHRLVKAINAHYDDLTRAIDAGHIGNYKDEASFTKAFGDPILKKPWDIGGQRWLYRHAVYKYSKDKVYLYFDHAGRLVKWEKLPCPKLF